MRVLRRCWLAWSFVCLAVLGRPGLSFGDELTFEAHIRPILKAHCFDCHGAEEELKGKLDLRLKRLMVKGGESGSAIEPGKPEASLLLQRIKAGEMPPGPAKVSAREVQVLERWITDGAKTAREEPAEIGKGLGITDEERSYWAFQPVRRPRVPHLKSEISNWKSSFVSGKALAAGRSAQPSVASANPLTSESQIRTPVDAFILDKLQERGLSFAPEADKLTLLRRASFDLLGLPPSRDVTEAFLDDNEPDAYERLVDRLLASPHYGERWGRHWLDAVGYADSDGYTINDRDRPYAYKYRDWVVRAFNSDKPLDQFLIEQLAGDELLQGKYANLSPDEIELLTATGFLRMASDGSGDGSVDQDTAKNAVVADTLKIVSSSLLGLTVGCAQCHDHRYDPISQADYYRLRAIFEPALNWKAWRNPNERLRTLFTDSDRAASSAIEAEVAKVADEKNKKQAEYIAQALELELQKHPEELRGKLKEAYQTPADKRTPEQQQLLKERPSVNISPGVLYQYLPKAAEELKQFDTRMGEMRSKKPVEDFLHVLTEDAGTPPPTHLFHRGDHRQPKENVIPAMLTIAAPPGQTVEFPIDDPKLPTTGRRLAFAHYLVSGKDPLLGRALANRIWMHHFGRGLVGTPGDFGQLGERPTHPELLDWLASELVGRWGDMEMGRNESVISRPTTPSPHHPISFKSLHHLRMTSTVYRQSTARRPELDAVDPSNLLLGRMSVRRLDAEVLRDRVLAASGSLVSTMFGKPIPVAEDFVGQVIVNDASRRSVYVQAKRSKPETLMRAFDAPVMESNCDKRISSTVATQSLMFMNSEFILKQAAAMAGRVRAEAVFEPSLPFKLDEHLIPERTTRPWQFGFGEFDAQNKRTKNFTQLPHWTGSSWQGGPALPDPLIGFAILNAAGGHAGNDARHAVIRRWTAPASGVVSITGQLHHPSENGDGVRGRIISNRSGLAEEWIAQHSTVETPVPSIEVQPGDTLDLATDCRESVTSDSFGWTVTIKLKTTDGQERSWPSDKTFTGPPPPSLANQVATVWHIAYGRPITREELTPVLTFLNEQLRSLSNSSPIADNELQAMTDLCQALLSSNEFLYVD